MLMAVRKHAGEDMPELIRFFGIIVRMYLEPGAPHHEPHFHVYFGEASAVVSIDPIEVIGGSLPRKQQRLVMAWAELRQDELAENWHLLQSGQPTYRIAPLD